MQEEVSQILDQSIVMKSFIPVYEDARFPLHTEIRNSNDITNETFHHLIDCEIAKESSRLFPTVIRGDAKECGAQSFKNMQHQYYEK